MQISFWFSFTDFLRAYFQKPISQVLLSSKNVLIEDQAFDKRLSYCPQNLSQRIPKTNQPLENNFGNEQANF